MGEVDLEGQTLVEIGKGALAAGGWEPQIFSCLRMQFEFWPITVPCPQLKFALQGLEACGPGRPYAGIGEAIQVLWLLWLGLLQCSPSQRQPQKKHCSICRIWTQSLQEYCKKEESGRFKPVPAFTGHGIGTYFHGPPGGLLRHADFHFQLLLA